MVLQNTVRFADAWLACNPLKEEEEDIPLCGACNAVGIPIDIFDMLDWRHRLRQ